MQSLFKINSKVLERHAQSISIPVETYVSYIEETSAILSDILLKTDCPIEQIPIYLETIYQTAIIKFHKNDQEPIYNAYCRLGKLLKSKQVYRNVIQCAKNLNTDEFITLLTSRSFLYLVEEFDFQDFPTLDFQYLSIFCYISEIKYDYECDTNFQLIDIILLSSYTPLIERLDLLYAMLPDIYFYVFLSIFDTTSFSNFTLNKVDIITKLSTSYSRSCLLPSDYIDILSILLDIDIPIELQHQILDLLTPTTDQSDDFSTLNTSDFNELFMALGDITRNIIEQSTSEPEDLPLIQGF